ncbi:MAG: DUF4381 domain-containing protein [Granulosicoccus sp.]
MTDEQQFIFNGLRDLHQPPSINMWPPAIGWWVVAIVLTAVIACTAAWFVRYRRQHNPRWQAAKALRENFTHWQTNADPALYLLQSHRVLRQFAIELAGRHQVASLCGVQWVDWLELRINQPLPEVARFSLGHGAYQREVIGNELIEQVHAAYLQWVDLAREPESVLPDEGVSALEVTPIIRTIGTGKQEINSTVNARTHA